MHDIQVQESPDGSAASITAKIKQCTAGGRIPSATDPEQRHGTKSASHRFCGRKASIAAGPQSLIIVAADVLPGDAGDPCGLELVEQAEVFRWRRRPSNGRP